MVVVASFPYLRPGTRPVAPLSGLDSLVAKRERTAWVTGSARVDRTVSNRESNRPCDSLLDSRPVLIELQERQARRSCCCCCCCHSCSSRSCLQAWREPCQTVRGRGPGRNRSWQRVHQDDLHIATVSRNARAREPPREPRRGSSQAQDHLRLTRVSLARRARSAQRVAFPEHWPGHLRHLKGRVERSHSCSRVYRWLL